VVGAEARLGGLGDRDDDGGQRGGEQRVELVASLRVEGVQLLEEGEALARVDRVEHSALARAEERSSRVAGGG
jgi:hypothetical protein